MTKKEKIFKVDMGSNELVERVAKTDSNEVAQVSWENINDKILDEFIKRLEDNINHDENGIEFWYATKLQEILEYGSWDKFQSPLKKAQTACQESGIDVDCNFSHVGKIVETGIATKEIDDYKLTRYACYLIAQNADARKKIVAFGYC